MLAGAISRQRVQQLIRQGAVTVSGRVVQKPALALAEGQTVTVRVPPLEETLLVPEALALTVLFEDAHLLVLHKPRGMLTHPTGKQRHGTLVNALLHHTQGQLSGINGILRPGILHRLDRDTSGLMVVAKSDAAHCGLARQLQAREISRVYQALAQGVPTPAQGTLVTQMGRHPVRRDKQAVLVSGGRQAITHWQVLETAHGRFSRLQLRLETGRTHQIRVHLAHLGHPIVGDPLYGTGLEVQWQLPRVGQRLQAVALSFQHPVSGQPMHFQHPLDAVMQATWATLSAALPGQRQPASP
jgi:23S rRNA pseudouridine1911/1915/1917 synthase